MLSFNPQSYFALSIHTTTSPLSLQEGFYGKYDLNKRSCYYVLKISLPSGALDGLDLKVLCRKRESTYTTSGALCR
jgi:hypothetical protein